MLEESTGLSFKTVQKVLQRLSGEGFVAPAGKIGNAQAYQFRVEDELHELIEWATKYQFTRTD
jgi:DNA-binding transcriptional regulator YhcF (GntR family)